MSSTRNQLPADRATAKPRRAPENKRRVLCLTCGKPIRAYEGVAVDVTPGKVRGYRHPACPAPKSKRRDPHALGKHVLRIKPRSGGSIRACGVRGCHYAEYWDRVAQKWLPLGGSYVGPDAYAPRTPEPALVNMPLFAS